MGRKTHQRVQLLRMWTKMWTVLEYSRLNTTWWHVCVLYAALLQRSSGSMGYNCFRKHAEWSHNLRTKGDLRGNKTSKRWSSAEPQCVDRVISCWFPLLHARFPPRLIPEQLVNSQGSGRAAGQTNHITCLPVNHIIPTVCSDRKHKHRTHIC